ncbi:hypothetical protein ANANG_G00081120, partial [Anguilla anguilla]
NIPCNVSPEVVNELFSVAQAGGIIPDITLDRTLNDFLSLNSSEVLSQQYLGIQRSLPPERLASYNQDLATTFGPGAQVPFGGVGIVALALSLFLEVLAHENTADPIKRIFGADHSTDIGTLVSEYLKQVPRVANDSQKMAEVPRVANDSQKMAEVTERYDRALTYELMDYFEEMTIDRRISSAGMKQWLNGAAFHLHLRIHQVRMGTHKQGSAESLGVFYKFGIPGLFKTYTDYLQRNARETPPGSRPGVLVVEPSRNITHRVQHRPCESEGIANMMVRKVLEVQGLQRTVDFFEETGKHIESLINQRGNFSLLSKVLTE